MLKHGGSYVLVAGEGDAMMSNLRCWLFVPVAMLLMTVSGALRAHEQTTPLAASGAQSGEYLFTGWDGPSLPVF
jgi:hypothetical protein